MDSIDETLFCRKSKGVAIRGNDLVICTYFSRIPTLDNCCKSKNVKFIVLEPSKLQLNMTPGLLVHMFKRPMSDKVKVAKRNLKYSITIVFCID